MRRRLTRRGTSSRAQSRYVEEEEGYVSGEYEDDGPFELIRIRVKVSTFLLLNPCYIQLTDSLLRSITRTTSVV